MQAHMMEQQEIYSNHIACMTTQTKQVSRKIPHVLFISGCDCQDLLASSLHLRAVKSRQCRTLFDCMLGPCAVRMPSL